MSWSRRSLRLSALLDEELADVGCERRLSIAGPVYTLNGRVLAAVRDDSLALLLPEEEGALPRKEGAGPRGADRSPVPGLSVLPEEVWSDARRLHETVRRAVDYARGRGGPGV